MRELYVYYRLRADAATGALQAARDMQARLCAEHPGLIARLLRRPDDDPQQTWMEIYALHRDGDPAGITPQLEVRIEEAAAAALAPFIVGSRHVEAFIPCAS